MLRRLAFTAALAICLLVGSGCNFFTRSAWKPASAEMPIRRATFDPSSEPPRLLLCIDDGGDGRHLALPLETAGQPTHAFVIDSWQGKSPEELADESPVELDSKAVKTQFAELTVRVDDADVHASTKANPSGGATTIYAIDEELIAVFYNQSRHVAVLPRRVARPGGERTRRAAIATLLTPPAVVADVLYTALVTLPTAAFYYGSGESENFRWTDDDDWPWPPLFSKSKPSN